MDPCAQKAYSHLVWVMDLGAMPRNSSEMCWVPRRKYDLILAKGIGVSHLEDVIAELESGGFQKVRCQEKAF